jgi:hypothetical protein
MMKNNHPVRLACQPPAGSTFSLRTNQPSATSQQHFFLSEQISTSRQPPAQLKTLNMRKVENKHNLGKSNLSVSPVR